MTETEIQTFCNNFLSAWTSQDVDRVLAIYTEDVQYSDPNTRGMVDGADAMRRYLSKLFARWTMSWHLREAHLCVDGRTAAVLWRAQLQLRGHEKVIEVDGMDLVVMRDDRISRNEVYFDRSVLAKLGFAG